MLKNIWVYIHIFGVLATRFCSRACVFSPDLAVRLTVLENTWTDAALCDVVRCCLFEETTFVMRAIVCMHNISGTLRKPQLV